MIIKLNDNLHEIAEDTTLEEFVQSLGIQLIGVAIAINNEVILRRKWSETTLTDGMTLMMIQAVSGG